jgi:osmoprotectant transport system substrate-binding protein
VRLLPPLHLTGLFLTLVAGLGAAADAGAADRFRVGSKNFTEQLILGEIYAEALEGAGIAVERKLNLGGTLVAHQALLNDQIDMYPEYTGTGLINVLKAEPMTDPKAVYAKVKAHYETELKLTWLTPSPMNNTYVLVIRPDTAAQHHLKTLSDLAKVAGQLKLGAGPEFRDRKDGIPGLKAVYGIQFAEDRQFPLGIRYNALVAGRIDAVDGNSTDGQISANKLVRLVDDKHLWPPYNMAPVVRQPALQAFPNAAALLDKVSALIDDTTMSEMNGQVDGGKSEPRTVARAFVRAHNLGK